MRDLRAIAKLLYLTDRKHWVAFIALLVAPGGLIAYFLYVIGRTLRRRLKQGSQVNLGVPVPEDHES